LTPNEAATPESPGDDRLPRHQRPKNPKIQWLKALALVLFGLLAIILIALSTLWWWTGTEGSLATTIRLVQRHFAASPQQLSAEGVAGSLRAGGRINSLQWRQENLRVEATDVSLAWQPLSVLSGALRLKRVAAATLVVDDQRPPTPLAGPPDNISLPLSLTLDEFSLGRFRLTQRTSPDPVEITDLRGRYVYSNKAHQIDLVNVQAFGGQYSGRAVLNDSSPLQLDANLSGGLALSVPGGSTTLPVTFHATARGLLTELSVNATAQTGAPVTAASSSSNTGSGTPTTASTNPAAVTGTQPNVSLTATVTPWAAQPIPRAEATFNQLNIGALWPKAPQTALNGSARVRPLTPQNPATSAKAASQSWAVQMQLANTIPGAIDQQRLPLEELQASAEWRDSVLTIESLKALVAGGELVANGTWAKPPSPASGPEQVKRPSLQAWKLEAVLKNVNPARLHSQLAPLPVAGKATASSEDASINFDANLQASGPVAQTARNNPLVQLRLQSASASGNWNPVLAGGTLNLSALRIRTEDAELAGTLEVQVAQLGGQGKLTLSAPGLNAAFKGEVREKTGAGDLELRMRSAAETIAWSSRLPGLPAALQRQLRSAAASGSAQLSAKWQGGWRDPVVQARLSVPTLDLRLPANAKRTQVVITTAVTAAVTGGVSPAVTAPPLQRVKLSDVQADLSGKLSQAQFGLRGRAEVGDRRLRLQMNAEGGQAATPGRASTLENSAWQGVIKQLDASVIDPAVSPGAWGLGLRQPVTLRWTPAAKSTGAPSFEAGLGEAVLQAPTGQASSATISWQPVRWANNQLTTAGKITGLPMAWAELFAGPQLAGSALGGDVIFDGEWDARLTDSINVKASLARRSGDITLQTETLEGRPSRVAAGIRQARISLVNEGDALSLALVWDSERAGSANGELKTRLTRLPATAETAGGWTWAADAPITGQLRAQLPRIGVWSVLAPPGWRIRGSVATNITISGNRANPQLSGTLQANDLALRSVADGFEFGNGRLRATLDGSRMRIDELSLQGASQIGPEGKKTGAGGLLLAQGEAAWVGNQPSARLTIKLERLRASIRTDRQITLSGVLQTGLEGKLVSVTGALKVDQARIVLPEEGTPQLGTDVVVRGAGGRSAGKTGPSQANDTQKTTAARDATPDGAATAVTVKVELDLGSDFRVQGKGLDTQLRGTLMLAADSLANPRLSGEIRTVGGQYRAYGQRLDVEQGIIRFAGRLDNPTLDILAIRPNLSQRVGVQIQGTALLPRVRLYAEPDLPDAEKLSWLVLGRSSASGGGEAALLQQAAVALLGSKSGTGGGLASRFGLDELSYRDSSGGAGGSALTLGKRFSDNFYAAYERSLSGTAGTLRVFYDLSRRFTVRAETGQQSAIDLIFTFQYD